MSKEYLSEAALFACDPKIMKFKAKEMANHTAKHKGRKLLTVAAVLLPDQAPMPCPLLGYPPPPCPCVVSPLIDNVRPCAKANLVDMNAYAMCPAGQKVRPIVSGTSNLLYKMNAEAAQVDKIAWPEHETSKGNEPAAGNGRASAGSGVGTALAALASAALTAAASRLGQTEKPNGTDAKAEKPSPAEEADAAPRPGMLCSCGANKPECRDCAYRKDNEPADVNNKSNILRENYNAAKPHSDRYDDYFDGTVEPLGSGKPNRWRFAAHHLISGNQVFKQNPELVRLARFCGYDINAYENCIMLVGYPEDYPDCERMKSVSAYDVMSEGRVQWHVGGHSYTFADADEKAMICKQIGIRNKINMNPADIKTYAELVQEEISRLTYRLENKKNRQPVCFADPQAKRQLRDKLNRVSRKIKDKLAAFTDEGKPHHSFPFYVSKEAYRFTYGLPRTGKVITVLKDSGRLILTKYRLERFTEVIADRERNLLIKPGETLSFDLADQYWRRDCIVFCDNVSFFVYLDDTPRDVLPFAVERERQFPPDCRDTGRDGRRFLEEHNTELLVWLRDTSDQAYVSPAVMVKKRLKELDESVD